MGSARLGLLGSVIMATVVMAGCTPRDDAASGGGDTAATSAPSASASGAPAVDAATKATCTTISGDIKTTMAKVADAEKIGPPAGHSAVSAQYSAGAAVLYANTFTSSASVNDATKQVADAMSDLADTYATPPKGKPSKAALDAAVKGLEAACAAS
ncbi:hypothetical protein SAMN05444365_10663 [Micromonospora pattaloongensis]|uniref:Uncharacterized protein n=1 Tax=Micromonospora pattaloongensis TaxID=405436 RepID=A0A1H3QQL6_9ACTN|nr:hypothetical protein [Micromonospora pattaloongensis]SDZ15583.1 hypothetical protein SAMN05444365_10663 [Micromonospora pattaloongensis]